MRCFPSDPSNDGGFGCVNNVSNDRGKATADSAERIAHEGAMRGGHFQRLTYNVKAVVDEAVFQWAMERLLDTNKLRARK